MENQKLLMSYSCPNKTQKFLPEVTMGHWNKQLAKLLFHPMDTKIDGIAIHADYYPSGSLQKKNYPRNNFIYFSICLKEIPKESNENVTLISATEKKSIHISLGSYQKRLRPRPLF